MRNLIIVGLCAAAIVGISAPVVASAEVGIYLNIGPPPVRYEAVPVARPGYLWAPGYWNAKNNRHVWQSGHWERNRKGYNYAQPTWTQHDNRWQLERGHWNKGG